jgi:recombination protein RecA
MAKKEKPIDSVPSKMSANEAADELANILSDSLNKKFKDQGQVVYTLNDKENPSNIVDWVSTGNAALDLLISNTPNGGVAAGRLTEITGLESSGKSLLAGHLIANTQRKGGLAIYIENETSLFKAFLETLGVDTAKMLYVNLDTVEDIFAAIEDIVIKVREKNKNRLVTIIVDSIAAASSKVEQEATYDKAGYNTTKAIVISQAMRKLMPIIARQRVCLVCINQLREKVGLTMPGADKYSVPGGKAIGFHATTRIRVAVTGKIKMKINGVDEIVGTTVKAKIVKSKLGPANREIEYEAFYNAGIKDYTNWIDILVKYGKAEKVGMSYQIVDEETGEIHKYTSKNWEEVLKTNDAIRAVAYKQLCNVLVMDYENMEINTDDLIRDTNDNEAPILDNAE